MIQSRRLNLMKPHSSISQILSLLVISSLWSGTALAQDESQKRTRALRILAVGEAPPWEEKIQNGRRVEQDPPAGSIPPRQVQLTNREGVEEGSPAPLRLNQISGVIAVRPGPVPLHETGQGGLDPQVWHTLKFPTSAAAALGIIWRDPTTRKWSKARSLTLADDLKGFPAGRVRIINVSKYPIGLAFGKERGTLKSGQVISRGGNAGVFAKVPLELSIKNQGGRWIRVFAQEINQSSRERTNIILYTADGVDPLRPVNAVILREIGRTPTVPKKKR